VHADTKASPRRAKLTAADWLELTALLAILAAAAYLRWSWSDFDLDDSFITYTYSRSLASGHGFAFAGERVLGTTTPLYALLLAITAHFGLPIITTAKGIGMVSSLAGCVLVYLLGRASVGGGLGLLAAGLLAVNARHALVSMSGMETALYTTVCLAACYAFARQAPRPTALLAAAACLIRPDGLLLALALAIGHVVERRRVDRGALACFAVPLLAWAAYATYEWGTPVPTSITAKLAYPDYGPFRLEIAAASLGDAVVPALPLLAAIGLLYAATVARPLLPVLVWTGLYLGAFTRAPNFAWYYVPPIPGLILAVAAGIGAIFHLLRVEGGLFHGVWPWLRVPLGLATAWVLAGASVAESQEYRAQMEKQYGREVCRAYHSLGLWVRRSMPSEATIAVPEIGYVGYYGCRRVLDLAGLCSRKVIPYLHDRRYVEIVQDFRPDYVALTTEGNRPIHNAIGRSPWFRAHYRPAAGFPYRGEREYVVYERMD
jgi:hypothetical protein